MGKELRCEAVAGARFDTPQCKRMTTNTASGVPFCGDDHDFETPAEMWNRLYLETLYRANQYEKLLNAKADEIVALRKEVEIMSKNDTSKG